MRYLDTETTPAISRIGLGCWQFGSREWGYGQAYAGSEAQAIVRRAVELGVTLFDTAELYGFGRSERILGAALADSRESAFLRCAARACRPTGRSSCRSHPQAP